MGVKLSDFARKIVLERKLIRKNKGPSIVPLMIIRFIGDIPDEVSHYLRVPNSRTILLTVCQRTATIFGHADLTKLYSCGPYVDYSDWWNISEVARVRPPRGMATSRLLEINVDLTGLEYYDQRSLAG